MDVLSAARFALAPDREEKLTSAYRSVIKEVEGGMRPGTEETPGRAARAMLELTSGYTTDIPGLFKTFDAEGYDEMVAVRQIPFASLCEHHLLPFTGHADIVYIPSGRIVGLSKLARLVEAYSRRFQVQERLTAQIADALEQHLEPIGVLVRTRAAHSCMSLRGARCNGSEAVMNAIRGAIKDKDAARAEALSLIGC